MITEQTLNEPKFQDHKLMTNDIALKLWDCEFEKESGLVRGCGSFLAFSHQQHQQTFETRNKLKDADFCKFRFCPTCNWRRNMNISRELLEAFEAIEASRSVSYIFLTLTLRNPPTIDLKATVAHLNNSFRRMSQTKEFKNAILGHFKSLELTGDETKDGEVHPHFHVLLIVDSENYYKHNYISQATWKQMWKKALRVDYEPGAYVQKIKPKKKKDGTIFSALQSAVFEVAKYAVKHSDLTDKPNDEFASIITQTKGMRFFATGGLLKENINLIKCDDELINFREETEALWIEIEELIYEWKNGNYRLKS